MEKARLKTWQDVKTFDDIILKAERKIISDLEKEVRKKCPHVKKQGKFFYYCALNMPELKKEDKKPDLASLIYQRHVDIASLQLHCVDDFEKCCFYSGKLKW